MTELVRGRVGHTSADGLRQSLLFFFLIITFHWIAHFVIRGKKYLFFPFKQNKTEPKQEALGMIAGF